VLQFFLEGGTVVSARPSGTEPKIKFYINCVVPVSGGNLDAAKKDASSLCEEVTKEIEGILSQT
jgi:phosphoglucomutase